MKAKLFTELVESMRQMNEVVRGGRAPSREFHVDPLSVKALRSKPGLSKLKSVKRIRNVRGTLGT